MEYIAVVGTPSKFDHIITTNPDRPHNPAQPSVAVPDSGATWAFVLVAFVAVGMAAMKRRISRSATKAV